LAPSHTAGNTLQTLKDGGQVPCPQAENDMILPELFSGGLYNN